MTTYQDTIEKAIENIFADTGRDPNTDTMIEGFRHGATWATQHLSNENRVAWAVLNLLADHIEEVEADAVQAEILALPDGTTGLIDIIERHDSYITNPAKFVRDYATKHYQAPESSS